MIADNMPKEPYSNPNNQPPVFVVTTLVGTDRGRIAALFLRENDAFGWISGNPHLEVKAMDPADAAQQLVLEQDLYDKEDA